MLPFEEWRVGEGGGTAAGWRKGFAYLTSLWKTLKIGRG